MGRCTITLVLVTLIIGFGGGYLMAGREPAVSMHVMPGGGMMSQNIDEHFIVQMIPHHEGAVEMAKVALERSTRPEIRTLAENIITAQQKEIGDMTGWYQSWFGSVPPEGGMGMMMGSMEGDTAVLKSISQMDFDREFIEQMITHHEMAVMMAQMLQASTERAEMKQLASNIMTSQTREIEMMRNWLRAWYGR